MHILQDNSITFFSENANDIVVKLEGLVAYRLVHESQGYKFKPENNYKDYFGYHRTAGSAIFEIHVLTPNMEVYRNNDRITVQ